MSPRTLPESVRQRYSDNIARHVLGIARFGRSYIMESLLEQGDFSGLQLGYEPYIAALANHPMRLVDIARQLGISRQAAGQTMAQLIKADLIQQRHDPNDGRAKQLVLTQQGKELAKQGRCLASALEERFEEQLGQRNVALLERCTHELCQSHAEQQGQALLAAGVLAGDLNRLADYTERTLMHLTMAQGHPGLKLSFGQVLSAIGPMGGRIQQIAQLQGVSKQAISAVASELETLDYIYRDTDPLDARQKVLQFTPRGVRLITDSVSSVDKLSEQWQQALGAGRYQRFTSALRRLYAALKIEGELFTGETDQGRARIAQQLQAALGAARARQLGQLLLQP